MRDRKTIEREMFNAREDLEQSLSELKHVVQGKADVKARAQHAFDERIDRGYALHHAGKLVQAEEVYRAALQALQRDDETLAAQAAAIERNQQLDAEVRDLKEGLEMVEEKARRELGMVKPDEILVQIAPRR